MYGLLLRFAHDETGAAVVEYALLGSLIAIAIITALSNLSGNLTITFTRAGDFGHDGDPTGSLPRCVP